MMGRPLHHQHDSLRIAAHTLPWGGAPAYRLPGRAVATHVRVDNPLWTHTLFPIYLAILAWGPLWLMDPKIRKLFWKRS